ncbi:MAG: hypothetical protein ACLFUB_09055 [Cyclobacteriaceae bacterium]
MKLLVHLSVFYLMLLLLASPSLAQELIFAEDFENGTASQSWSPAPGKPNGVVEIFPTTSLQGEYAARLGKSKDDEEFTLNRLDLKVDLSNYRQVMMRLMVYHNHEDPHEQDGIFLSDDGGETFEKVYDFNFEQWPQQAGYLPPINLSRLAETHRIRLDTNTVIRFQQYDDDDFSGGADFSDGLYIDAITLTENNIPYAQLPFEEDFSADTLQAPWILGDPMLSDSSGHITPSGLVEISDEGGENGHVLKMGSRCDDCPATNALDLPLKLQGHDQVRLSFDILDNKDETHAADGIFFSDDGGKSFKKVFAFDFDNWHDDFFGSISALNVNRMAAEHGIQLNDQFVIRFQQHGDDDFDGTRLSSDGMMLDNIKVYNAKPVYASLPLEEDFESQQLDDHWQIGDPRSSEYHGEISNNGNIDIVSSPEDDSNHVVQLGNQRDKSYTTNALDLYLKLAAHPGALLSFRYYDHFDETHKEDGIFFSNDGGKSFKKVFSFDSDTYTDKQMGEFRALSIRRLAEQRNITLNDQFVIRFQQYDDDDFKGTRTISDGYYLDDIKVFEAQPEYATVPFKEEFSQDSLGKYWAFNDLGHTASDNHIRPGGMVAVAENAGFEESTGLIMGRNSDGHQTTNAIDLHLKLGGVYNLQLEFDMLNLQNDASEENGIWFSKDGGNSFSKIWHPAQAISSYKRYSLNLDSLVKEAGVSYSDQSVLRFQQSDSEKLNIENGDKRGLFLDNITIASALPLPVVSWPQNGNLPDCSEYEFTWTTSSRAEEYHLQIYTHVSGAEEIIIDTVVQDKSYKMQKLPVDSSLFCRVKMKNGYLQSSWSQPLVFHTYETFSVDLQIRGTVEEENSILLQASEVPDVEYQWFRDGEPVDEQETHLFSAKKPGKYHVYIHNQDCGIASPSVVLRKEAFDVITTDEKDTASGSDNRGGK